MSKTSLSFVLPLLGLSWLAPAGSLCAQARELADTRPLTETERIQHLLSRFSFGPTPGLVEEVRRRGIEKWIEAQLADDVQASSFLAERLEPLDTLRLPIRGVLDSYVKRLPPKPTVKERRAFNRRRAIPRQQLKDAVLYRAVYAPNQMREVASDFFRNHFNVSVLKGNCRYYAVEYEEQVIRAEALGDFSSMLEKSAKHPAMLVYLDNALSRRPPTKQELKEIERRVRRKTKSRERAEESVEIAKQRGLNENYARELLELHTLGVDNVYKQRDVIEVARALTGWTIENAAKKPVAFKFMPAMHAKGDKRFLGGTVRQDRKNPVSEGEAILERLVKHSGTARFLATKLCRYFVSDDPSPALVKRIASVFQRTRGDLKKVYLAILESPEFYAPENFQSKFKRPLEFVVSALRVTGAEIRATNGIHLALRNLSEPLYECEDPTGYYDQAEAWNDPGVMAVRWQFAMDLARGKVPGVKIPQSFYKGLHPSIPRVWKDQLAERLLPAGLSEKTAGVLDAMVRKYIDELGDGEEPRLGDLGPLIVGLLIGSPEFQRQ